MKFSNTATLSILFLSCVTQAFAPIGDKNLSYNKPSSKLFATAEEEKTETKKDIEIDPDAEGLPWWWDLVWKLDVMKPGVPGTDCTFGDSANVLKNNIEQIYGGYPSLDGCPLGEGDIADIADGTQFIGLQKYYNEYGSPYKLCFGPKSFLVISDPVQAKHVLRDANTKYDKGLLSGERKQDMIIAF
jgi:hypothetical protein